MPLNAQRSIYKAAAPTANYEQRERRPTRDLPGAQKNPTAPEVRVLLTVS
jgi:hypothetical protein